MKLETLKWEIEVYEVEEFPKKRMGNEDFRKFLENEVLF